MTRTTTRWRLRHFLVFCLAVTALLSACGQPDNRVIPDPPPGAAAQAGFAPFTFLQAGDPQIGGWTSIADTQGRFVELARIANRLQPAAVLVVGDLVNDGPHEKELAAFDEALTEFRVPVKLIPGNHDDIATYRRKYGPDHYSFTLNNCEFVCINSNLLAGGPPTPSARRPTSSGDGWRRRSRRRATRAARTSSWSCTTRR